MDILREEDEDSQHHETGGAGAGPRHRPRVPLRSKVDLDGWLPAPNAVLKRNRLVQTA